MAGRKRKADAKVVTPSSSVRKAVPSSKGCKATSGTRLGQVSTKEKIFINNSTFKKAAEPVHPSRDLASLRRSARLATEEGMPAGKKQRKDSPISSIETPRKRKVSRSVTPAPSSDRDGIRAGIGACRADDGPSPHAATIGDAVENDQGEDANCGAAQDKAADDMENPTEPPLDPREQEWRRQARLAGVALRLTVDPPTPSASTPGCVRGRDEQLREMMDFCDRHVEEGSPGGLYLSGLPGTGKSLCVDRLLAHARSKGKGKLLCVSLNCVAQVPEARLVYAKLLEGINGSCLARDPAACLAELRSALTWSRKKATKSKASEPLVLILLDEIDRLATPNLEVLYTLFQLPSEANSRCLLIAVANAIDLTERLLPRLASSSSRPELIPFPAYSCDVVLSVLQQRLEDVGCTLFEPTALLLCAKKVAATAGDMRQALSACRKAVDHVEREMVELMRGDAEEAVGGSGPEGGHPPVSSVSGQTGTTNGTPGAQPKLATEASLWPNVNFRHMAAALASVYAAPTVSMVRGAPLHQQITLCAAALTLGERQGSLEELDGAYRRACARLFVPPLDSFQFPSVCAALQEQGLLSVVRGAFQQSRNKKLQNVRLRMSKDDVILALQGLRFFQKVIPHN